MSQGSLPTIRGAKWQGNEPLEFNNPLPVDAARDELMRFIIERHDGFIEIISTVWGHVVRDETTFDGESWHYY